MEGIRRIIIAVLVAAGCGGSTDADLAASVADAIASACPASTASSSETARDACADRLADLPVLRDAMREPFIWGGQGEGYRLDRGTTKFNPRVWRRMYLSTFAFSGSRSIESVGAQTVLHMSVTFRGGMPSGAYPYPFWHSDKKWKAYSYATTIHFVIQGGRILGALRGSEQDVTRSEATRTWDGRWAWDDGKMPYASLYGYLFSTGNPYALWVDRSYRALEARMRKHGCPTCHSPDNRGGSKQLELLIYPNQAIVARHDIVDQLSDDLMPPDNDLGIEEGIPDSNEREVLIGLAKEFAVAGDLALSWECEPLN